MRALRHQADRRRADHAAMVEQLARAREDLEAERRRVADLQQRIEDNRRPVEAPGEGRESKVDTEQLEEQECE